MFGRNMKKLLLLFIILLSGCGLLDSNKDEEPNYPPGWEEDEEIRGKWFY